jgi:uncharacterized protein with von Willebrand factor type A (vWA) domain
MSLLDKLKRGKRRDEIIRAPQLHKHSVEHGSLDQWVVDDLMRDSPRFRERVEAPIELDDTGRTYEPATDIHQDLFLGAHTAGETRVRPPENMRPSHKFGRDVIGEVFKTDDFKDAKPYMELDKLSSALFTFGAGDKLDELMRDKSVQDQMEQSQDAHEAEQSLEDVLGELDQARGEAKAEHDANGQVPQDLADKVKDLTGQREDLIEKIATMPESGIGPNGPVVKAAADEVAAEGKRLVDAWDAIAGTGASELADATPDEAMQLVESWEQIPDFMELCKLLGRIHRDFRAQEARNIIGGVERVVGIEFGNNLTSTLPSELIRLSDPVTERSFYRDYMDEQLLQFRTEGTEKVDLGPGVLCIDLSGSMGGRKAIEAKAVAIGFVRLMHRKRRDATVLCFNGSVMWEHHFPQRDGIEMAQLLKLAGLTPSGGTNITKAVERAEKLINTQPAFKRADVLVVTDGEDRTWSDITDGVRERFEKAGVRRHGIAIGHTPKEGGWLLKFCDDAISVKDLTEATGDIVRAIS